MAIFLSILYFLTVAIPLTQTTTNVVSSRPATLSKLHYVDKRMLSQLLQGSEQSVNVKAFTVEQLDAIAETHRIIIHQLQTVKVPDVKRPLLLFVGNTPA